jgi:para-nitrobenzyl esterase
MIFGQSGGGSKTSTMMACRPPGPVPPRGDQSGSTLRQATKAEASAEAEKLKALSIGKKNIADIQKVSWQQLLEAQIASSSAFRPVVDGNVLPHHPFDPGAPVESADVPLIISTTLHDAALRLTNFELEKGPADIFRQLFGARGRRSWRPIAGTSRLARPT